MSCEKYIILLDEFLNDELDAQTHSAVAAHLDDCAACGEEIRLLRLDTAFYRKAAIMPEHEFAMQWKAMRERLVAESLISRESAIPQKGRNSFITVFLARFESLFRTKSPVFGTLALIVLGLATMFLLSRDQTGTESQVVAVVSPSKVSNAENPVNPPENNVSGFAPEDDSERKTVKENYRKSPPLIKRKVISGATGRNYEKTKLRVKQPEKTTNADAELSAVRRTFEKEDKNFQITREDDEKLAKHLNKVHLFLLMFRNLGSDETINAVLGNKYQTEARTFLDNNNYYKKAARRAKNIPAVELLNEIEPVLQAVSNLDERGAKDNIGNAAMMVKQSGVVFKIRFWMSAAKAVRVL